MSEVKYPEVAVELVGRDGNAFAIMARVKRELRRAGVSREEIDEFLAECMSGDYDHLLQTCMKWVTVS
jgi:SOS response regulatory protein OraA/RecX